MIRCYAFQQVTGSAWIFYIEEPIRKETFMQTGDKTKIIKKSKWAQFGSGLAIVAFIGAIILLGSYIVTQSKNMKKINNEVEQLQHINAELQITHTELENQLQQVENDGIELEKQLEMEERTIPAGRQVFYGVWDVDIYYPQEKLSGKSNYPKTIKINKKGIWFENCWTEEPFFNMAARYKWDVYDELKGLGIEEKEVDRLLKTECYAEMNFAQGNNWLGNPSAEELDFINHAKYYVLGKDTMICILLEGDNAGKAYILCREQG